jgi:hypothetical protein
MNDGIDALAAVFVTTTRATLSTITVSTSFIEISLIVSDTMEDRFPNSGHPPLIAESKH